MRIIKVSNGINNKLGSTELDEKLKNSETNEYNSLSMKEKAKICYNFSLNRARQRFPKIYRENEIICKEIFNYYYKSQKKNQRARKYDISVRRSYQVDHIIPLNGKHVCGLHLPWNLHIINSVINSAKK